MAKKEGDVLSHYASPLSTSTSNPNSVNQLNANRTGSNGGGAFNYIGNTTSVKFSAQTGSSSCGFNNTGNIASVGMASAQTSHSGGGFNYIGNIASVGMASAQTSHSGGGFNYIGNIASVEMASSQTSHSGGGFNYIGNTSSAVMVSTGTCRVQKQDSTESTRPNDNSSVGMVSAGSSNGAPKDFGGTSNNFPFPYSDDSIFKQLRWSQLAAHERNRERSKIEKKKLLD